MTREAVGTELDLQLEGIDENDPGFVNLLENENLPTEDLRGDSKRYFGFRDGRGGLVAAGGLEACGVDAILRSCVVAPEKKGQGFGGRLVVAILDEARQRRLERLFLLTESSPGFFRNLGFREFDRGAVPAAVAGSRQFSEICPDSAVAMALRLDVSPAADRPGSGG